MSEPTDRLHAFAVDFARLVARELAECSAEHDESATALSWRERLWTAPDETRLGVSELSEALGRPESWTYRHCSPKSGLELLPHRKLDGALVFIASEIRSWVREHEEVVVKAKTATVIPIARQLGR